jgi:hypothetical protein
VKALAEKEKATLNDRTIPTDVQPQISDPVQVKAESDREKQERRAQRGGGPEQLQSQGQRKLEQAQKWQISGAAASPAVEATSPTPSPAAQATSPTPSSAVDDTFSVPSATPQ